MDIDTDGGSGSRRDMLTMSHIANPQLVNQPLVFDHMISHWPASSWTPRHMARLLNGKTVKCRLGCLPCFQECSEIQWEKHSLYHTASMDDLVDWAYGERAALDLPNPVSQCTSDQLWAYIDYKYVKDIFHEQPDVFKAFDWSHFGVGNRDGYHSTLWMGTRGAHTCCHYDTYGFNLVAQLHGRKRWVLFPPEDTNNLYPTRIPYEESSVFSEVNIKVPDVAKYPKFKDCHAYVVTLNAGQVLYVPRHWWHFVECLEMSISANTWVEMPNDDESRVEEAITRLIISKWSQHCQQDFRVNPHEDLEPEEMNWHYLSQALSMSCTSTRPSIPSSSSTSTPTANFQGHSTVDDCKDNVWKAEPRVSSPHHQLPNHLQNFSDCVHNLVREQTYNLLPTKYEEKEDSTNKACKDTTFSVATSHSKSTGMESVLQDSSSTTKRMKQSATANTPHVYRILPSPMESLLVNPSPRCRAEQCQRCKCLKESKDVSKVTVEESSGNVGVSSGKGSDSGVGGIADGGMGEVCDGGGGMHDICVDGTFKDYDDSGDGDVGVSGVGASNIDGDGSVDESDDSGSGDSQVYGKGDWCNVSEATFLKCLLKPDVVSLVGQHLRQYNVDNT
ncbi:hypothetical protein Ahia01_000313000 [Argonauta hians]